MTQSVYIVGLGARTPVGLRADSSAAAVRASISRLTFHPFLVDSLAEPLRSARDGRLPATMLGRERLVELARSAISEAAEWVTANVPIQTLPILLAMPEPRPGLTTLDAEWVARKIAEICRPRVTALSVEYTSTGHAGSLQAIEIATTALAEGRLEVCLVGGVDSYFETETMGWLEAQGMLRRDGVRGGILPGEGAGVIALASNRACDSLRLTRLARITGAASSTEPRLRMSDTGLLGEGLTDAIVRAVRGRPSPTQPIDAVFVDINGERHRADEWGFAALRLGGLIRDAGAWRNGVGSWGDTGAASGSLGCVLAVQAWRRSYSRGATALVCGGSWSGLRSAVILEEVR